MGWRCGTWDWEATTGGEVLGVLKGIMPVYDRVNSRVSFGRDAAHRERTVRGRIASGDRVLDAGSGLGNMSKADLRRPYYHV